MEIKSVVNNGVQIPNECTCIWCGSKMKRGGANRMGAGVNSFALWCDNCGAVVIHACDFGKKITGYISTACDDWESMITRIIIYDKVEEF